VEDVLFGHEKGAFTGARDSQPGVLERCHEGVVFLDEVADLPLKTQVSLLRVLQEGTVRRLGVGAKERPARPRVISATHKDLHALMAKGLFREDLFHRLSACVLHLPPLCERREDIPLLAEHELRSVSPALQPILKGEIDAFLEQHAGYSWPGNVRELTKVVHSLALGITPQLSGAAPARTDVPEEIVAGRWSLKEVRRWYARHVSSLGGSRTEVARKLEIDRGTLRELLGDTR
jgi:two-component system, NtrC family, response regulator GlrR